MLIESDKRGVEWSIPLTYSDGLDDKFYVPVNLHIIGLMNTADRSLAMVDYALRRRFAFVDLEPGFNTNAFSQYLLSKGTDKLVVDSIISKMNTINDRISNDATNLGKGYCIGHSFFCTPAADESSDKVWFNQIIESEIAPLLREYWFDDPSQAESLIDGVLLADI